MGEPERRGGPAWTPYAKEDQMWPVGFGPSPEEPPEAETTVSSTPIPEPTPPGPENRRQALQAAATVWSGTAGHANREAVALLAEFFETWLNR